MTIKTNVPLKFKGKKIGVGEPLPQDPADTVKKKKSRKQVQRKKQLKRKPTRSKNGLDLHDGWIVDE